MVFGVSGYLRIVACTSRCYRPSQGGKSTDSQRALSVILLPKAELLQVKSAVLPLRVGLCLSNSRIPPTTPFCCFRPGVRGPHERPPPPPSAPPPLPPPPRSWWGECFGRPMVSPARQRCIRPMRTLPSQPPSPALLPPCVDVHVRICDRP